MLELHLPYPPSVNHIYRRSRYGGVYLSKETVTFKKEVWLLAKEKKISMFSKDKFLSIEIDMHPPDKRKRDIDNINKQIFDALMFSGIIFDDSQFVELKVSKKNIIKGGLVIVRIDYCQ